MKDLSTRFQTHQPSGGSAQSQITARPVRFWSLLALAAAIGLFILLAVALIPKVGIEDDEVIFVSPLYLFLPKEFAVTVFHRQIPLMVMTYLGTLKTFLLVPIFHWFGSNIWTLRLPMTLAGAATIFILYKLGARSVSRFAGLTAAFLLAADPSFVFMDTVDWGPVALEHFLLVTGSFFIVKFAQQQMRRDLAIGFFLLGLALWNKAIFLWALAGLFCATIVVFWPEILRLLRPSTAAIAVASFCAGALPLIVFNLRNPNITLRNSGRFETNAFAGKANILRGTLDGSSLFGFLFGLDDAPNPKQPTTLHGRAAVWLGHKLGQPRRTPLYFAYLLALLLIPWWWKYRAARFSLIFMAVTWLAMAVTREAGGSSHHAVLLWPFPQLFLATALAAMAERGLALRRAVIAVVAVLVAIDVVVVNQAIADVERYGSPQNFSDASIGLVRAAKKIHAPQVFTLDWGMVNMLAFASRGRLSIATADPNFMTDAPSPENLAFIDWALAQTDAVYVDHLPGFENYDKVRLNFDRTVAARGLQKVDVQIICDSNGHPVFEIFRLKK